MLRILMVIMTTFSFVTEFIAPAAAADKNAHNLFVFCAGGLRKPVETLSREFEAREGVSVEISYDGSNTLLSQIKLNRKGDIYIAGDAGYIETAQKDSLVNESRALCWFVPVIIVKKGNPLKVKALTDLTKHGVKIGQADAKTAAIGRVMPGILSLNGVDSLAWLSNVALVTTMVNELAVALKLGTIDAAVVWSAIANNYKDVADQVLIPFEKNIIPEAGAAVLTFSKDSDAAGRYLQFLSSQRGRAIFMENGYVVDKPVK